MKLRLNALLLSLCAFVLGSQPAAATQYVGVQKIWDGAEPSSSAWFRFDRSGNGTYGTIRLWLSWGGTATISDVTYLPIYVDIPAYWQYEDVFIPVYDDSLIEGTEYLDCWVTYAENLWDYSEWIITAGAYASAYIYDNDYPVVTISAIDNQTTETHGSDPGAFRVTRTGPTTSALVVNISKSGTATAPPASGYDYTINGSSSAFTSVTIPAGSASVDIAIQGTGYDGYEPTETIIFTVSSGTGYVVGSPSSGTINVIDDN